MTGPDDLFDRVEDLDVDEEEVDEEPEAIPPPIRGNTLTPEQHIERRAVWKRLLVDFCQKPRPRSTMKIFAVANMPSGVVDEMISEAFADGLLETYKSFKGPLIRTVGSKGERAAETSNEELMPLGEPVALQKRATDLPDAPRRPPGPAQSKPATKELPVAKKQEWMSAEDAAKLLGSKPAQLSVLAADGKIESRKAETDKPGRKPVQYLRSSLIAYQPNFLDAPPPPQGQGRQGGARVA